MPENEAPRPRLVLKAHARGVVTRPEDKPQQAADNEENE